MHIPHTTNNQQPTINNQQPTTNNQQPTTNNQQPTTNNQQQQQQQQRQQQTWIWFDDGMMFFSLQSVFRNGGHVYLSLCSHNRISLQFLVSYKFKLPRRSLASLDLHPRTEWWCHAKRARHDSWEIALSWKMLKHRLTQRGRRPLHNPPEAIEFSTESNFTLGFGDL